ncbi:MAG: hypothetical protein JWL81_2885 [Verrucomicrobiales bacterium]|nr:hypothetical protein [Verrucomicrobiales bacterium]
MTAVNPPPASPAPRPRRRWLRRVLVVLAALIVLLVIFFKPLGYWALQHFGTGALAEAGLSGSWKSSGTLLTGLKLDEVKLTGNESAQVRSVTMRHAEVDYDLWALRGGGPGQVLKKLVIQDADVEMDMTRPGPPPKPKSTPSGAAKKPELPDVVLPEIRIEHLNLRMKLANDVLLVRDFSLLLSPAAPGFISVEVLDIPGAPRMEKVNGITRMEPRRLILENTTLAPETLIEKLALDLADLSKDEGALELAFRQGPTRLELKGRAGGWFTTPTADLNLEISGINQKTLEYWGVPAGELEWRAGKLKLAAKGPVLEPDHLETALSLEQGGFETGPFALTDIQMESAMTMGRFVLTNLTASRGTGRVSAKAQAALPPRWDGIAKVPGDLDFTVLVPDLAAQVPAEAEVSGQASAEGRIGFADAKLTQSGVSVKASGLKVKGVPVESAETLVAMSGAQVVLEKAVVRLNAANGLTASGRLNLEGEKVFSVEWKAEAPDLSEIPAEVRPGTLWPNSGKVLSTGSAGGSLTKISARDFSGLTGQAVVDVTGLKMRDAALDSMSLRAGMGGGLVSIDGLSVRLDAENRLDATGTLGLAAEGTPVSGDLALRMPDVAKASSWSTQFGGPPLRAGRVEVDWKGSGLLKPLKMDSTGALLVSGLKLGTVPEVLSASAKVVQSGSTIEVSGLKAAAGPWRAEGSAEWDGWHLNVPGLKAFLKDQLLAGLEARVPWNAGKVPVNSPLVLKLKIDGLEASRLASALGKELPVQGRLDADGDFSGTLESLRGALTVEANGLRPTKPVEGPSLDPASVKLSLTVRDRRLVLEGTALQKPLQPLELTAQLPLDAPALLEKPEEAKKLPLQAKLKLPSSSLAFLPSWVPQLRSIAGTAAADLTVSGTLGSPVWQGSANVAASQAAFTSSALPTVKNLVMKARVNEKRLTLDEASVLLAGGQLRIQGGAGLERPTDPALDFKVTADEVLLVRDENISLRANAAITCRGLLSKAAVTGQVDLVRGRVFKEIEFLPLSLPNDLPPPPPATSVSRQGSPALPAPLDKWDFNIAIKTRDPVRLMGNVARGNAVADLRLSGSGARPDLTGKVMLRDMWLRLPFSRLNITEGAITFTKEAPFDPQIDVTGESINGSRIVQVFVQGRALDPKVRLTSSPPLPEGEIASLLATGVTTSDLTTSGDEAAGRAAFVVLKQTYRKLFRKSALSDDDDEPPRLSFDVSVFGSDPARRGVSAIYELNPRWRLIGKVAESGTFRGLLHYLIRFR